MYLFIKRNDLRDLNVYETIISTMFIKKKKGTSGEKQERRVWFEHEHHWRKKPTTDYVVSFFLILSMMGNHWEKRYDGPWFKSKVYSKEKTHVKLRRRRRKYGYRPMAIKTFFPRADDWAYRGKKDIQKIRGQKWCSHCH